jgi:hypothetical protein
MLGQPPRQLQPIHTGHADVEQHQVGLHGGDQAEPGLAVGRLAGDGPARDVRQQAPQALARQRFVVDDDQLHAASPGPVTGSRSRAMKCCAPCSMRSSAAAP